MVKEELQKELKEKVKEGAKSSDLKRSKSASDIPLPEPNTNYPHTQLVSQSEKIKELEKETKTKSNTIKLLREKIEKLENNPPQQLLTDQVKEKQREVEKLREELEKVNQKLTETTQELDSSLIARAKSVKQFGSLYEKQKQTELELIKTEDDATDEIISQDNEISKLRDENRKLKFSNQSLQRDLELAQRAVEWRKNPPQFRKNYSDDLPSDSLRFMFYSLSALLFLFMIWNSSQKDKIG